MRKSRSYDLDPLSLLLGIAKSFTEIIILRSLQSAAAATFSPVALGFISAGFWSRGLSGKLSATLLATSITGMPLP